MLSRLPRRKVCPTMVCGRSNDDPLKQHGIFINVYGGLNKNAPQRLKESSIVGGVILWEEV